MKWWNFPDNNRTRSNNRIPSDMSAISHNDMSTQPHVIVNLYASSDATLVKDWNIDSPILMISTNKICIRRHQRVFPKTHMRA